MECASCQHYISEYVDVECDNCGFTEVQCATCAVSKDEHYKDGSPCGIFRPA